MPDFTLSPAVDFNELINSPEPDYNWLIPGLLERGDRVIFTGNEGKGKSTLLRQIAVQAAAGIHPFSLEPMPSVKVLFIDLENGKGQVQREFKKLSQLELPAGQLQIARWASLDLNEATVRNAFSDYLVTTRPELLIIGPMYKLSAHLEREDESGQVGFFLDTCRNFLGFTLLMESHQPHSMFTTDGKKLRPERPFGSSLWMRWPEFGFCLEDAGTLRPWRGARDADREWPTKLKRDGFWPWMVDEQTCGICGNELSGHQLKYCSDKCAAAGRKRDERSRKRG